MLLFVNTILTIVVLSDQLKHVSALLRRDHAVAVRCFSNSTHPSLVGREGNPVSFLSVLFIAILKFILCRNVWWFLLFDTVTSTTQYSGMNSPSLTFTSFST